MDNTHANLLATGQDVLSFLDAEHYLETLIGPHWRTTSLVFQTFDDNKDRRKARGRDDYAHVREGSWEACRAFLANLNRQGAGVFLTVNETHGGRRREHLSRIRAVWCEWDHAAPPPDWPVAPHLIIESSPEKYHIYWVTADMTPEDHRRIMHVLVEKWGSDPGAADLVRVLRIPGFLHQKRDLEKGLLGSPWRVQLLSAESWDAFPPYPTAQILDLFHVPPQEKEHTQRSPLHAPSHHGPVGTTPLNVTEVKDALRVLPPHDRDLWLKIGMALASTHHASAFTLWDEWSRASPKYDTHDQQRVWLSFREHKEGENGAPLLTLGSFFLLAHAHGWRRPHEEPPFPSDDEAPPNHPREKSVENGIGNGKDPTPHPLSPFENQSYAFTDLGNGERFAARHGDRMRYFHESKKWYLWNDAYWAEDKEQQIEKLARATLREMYNEAGHLAQKAANIEIEEKRIKTAALAQAMLKWARASESGSRAREMVRWAQPDCIIDVSRLDADPWLLNCANGTMDLRTGVLRAHQQTDLLTKSTHVAFKEDAPCPLWEEFLSLIFQGNDELIAYLQCALGYSLTGITQEQCFFICHGSGSNGKTTFLETSRLILGDYSKTAAFSTFLHQDRDTTRNDLADLRGARFVVASEMDQGRRLSENIIKNITGGEEIKARFLFQEYFSYTPQLKLWLGSNHKPAIKGDDSAIWRRVHLIPFDVTIPEKERDKSFPEKLKKELSGILAWMVRGCLHWKENGLVAPEIVKHATDQYRKEENVFEQWLEECCEMGPEYQNLATPLYQSYLNFSHDKSTNQTTFGRKLHDKGFSKGFNAFKVTVRIGLRLLESA